MGSIWPDEIAPITADDPRLLFSTTRPVLLNNLEPIRRIWP
jgi:hypothetical protein